MALSLSHGGGETVYSSPSSSNQVLVGTLDGVAMIERSDAGWRVAYQALQGKHIHALIFEEESGTWFAGIRHSGIMASIDGGKSWESRDHGLTEKDVYCLSKAKLKDKARLLAGTEPACLFVSDDLGKTWTERPGLKNVPSHGNWKFPGPPHIAHLKHINFEPGNPHTIYGSIEVGALLKSTDDGVTWNELTGIYEDVHRCIVSPSNSKQLYVTGGMGLWRSQDGGSSWENTFTRGSEYGGYPDQLVFKPSDPKYMIISAGRKSPPTWREETAQTRISRSRDGGATWEIMGSGLKDRMPHSIEAMCLEEAGDKVQVFAGTTGGSVLWSGDGGEHWQTIIKGLAPVSKGVHYRGLVGQAA